MVTNGSIYNIGSFMLWKKYEFLHDGNELKLEYALDRLKIYPVAKLMKKILIKKGKECNYTKFTKICLSKQRINNELTRSPGARARRHAAQRCAITLHPFHCLRHRLLGYAHQFVRPRRFAPWLTSNRLNCKLGLVNRLHRRRQCDWTTKRPLRGTTPQQRSAYLQRGSAALGKRPMITANLLLTPKTPECLGVSIFVSAVTVNWPSYRRSVQ
uniref:Uncharacterized protein n=1 Tax=Romanomermis culicivorax TaxID=13658 RepID=A0A915K4W0_ROMCU